MKKWNRAAPAGMVLSAFLLLTACSAAKMDDKPVGEVSYTVVDKEEIPEELKIQIDREKADIMEITYGDQGYLYAVRGYGEQKTSGYSIEIRQCYEAKDAIYIETDLLGPEKTDPITETKTYPYVVVKMEYRSKPIVFK